MDLRWLRLLCISFIVIQGNGQRCKEQVFKDDSFVCVCDILHCDSFPQVDTPSTGSFKVITTSRDEFRFDVSEGNLSLADDNSDVFVRITLDSEDVRQTMIGFGGAFTDAAGINIKNLPITLRDTLIKQYYSPDGIEYNIGRVPIAGTDFSTHPYSYDDVEGDVDLENFSLTEEDHSYKIPFIQKAEEFSEREIHLFASPWSPPSWMKTNGMFNGSGSLIPEMAQPWANYYVKFLDAYKDEGLNLWGLTVQNEPSAGETDYPWNCCHYTDEQERDFVRDYLGPTLQDAGYQALKLMVGDDSRIFYPERIETILNDEVCNAYVDGVAVHWYTDDITLGHSLDQVHNSFPDKFILYTEACTGYLPEIGNHVHLGSWDRGERYASHIINNINHWSTGWTDWNLALSMTGGPNWASNFVDAPIIIDEEVGEFYKQPMFYVMGHFSKFVPEGSVKIGHSIEVPSSVKAAVENIDVAAFIDNDGYTVANVLNMNEDAKTISVEDSSGNAIIHQLPPKSLQTFIYKQ